MPSSFIGGDLRIVLVYVDLPFFVVAGLLFAIWRFTTCKQYLHSILCAAALSTLIRSILPLMLAFNFSLETRGDGVQIMWLRWLFYLIVWGATGPLHSQAEFTLYRTHFRYWIVSIVLALSFVGPWVASGMASSDQRIVAFALAALPLLAGLFLMWTYAVRWDFKSISILLLYTLTFPAYGVVYALGHSGWRIINLVWESVGYLIIDAVMIAFMQAVIAVFNCPCAAELCKKNDGLPERSCCPPQQPCQTEPLLQQQQQPYYPPLSPMSVFSGAPINSNAPAVPPTAAAASSYKPSNGSGGGGSTKQGVISFNN